MKRFRWIVASILWGATALLPITAFALEGVVLNERVNVRTRPSIASEVIHQLNTGTKVTILDRINLNDPQPGEPKEWFRIGIPEDTELWVSTEFLDPTNQTVNASRLNVRAGPGQNYSVVGRIERGTKVSILRDSAGWTAISPVAATVAYVASEFINVPSTADANNLIESAETTPSTETTTPPSQPARAEAESVAEIPDVIIDDSANSSVPASTPPSNASTPPTITPPPIFPVETPSRSQPTGTSGTFVPLESPSAEESLFDKIENPRTIVQPQTSASFTTPPAQNNGLVAMTTVVPSTAEPIFNAEPLALSDEVDAHLKRVITRDGIVRKSRNIQSPTYHRLDDPRTGSTINYLYTGKLQVDLGTGPKALQPYEGRKIRVMGVEAVDARWPKIPVIEVEKLRVLE